MQTEFIEWCGSFIAFSMIIGVLYVAYTTKNPTDVSDVMTIGYVEEDRPQNIVVTMPVIDEQLKIDCIDTLVKLGMKKEKQKNTQAGVCVKSTRKHSGVFEEGSMINNLKNMRTYLAGAMDRVVDGGVGWRNAITPMLQELSINVINPCDKPIESAKEGPDTRTIIDYYKQTGQFNKIRRVWSHKKCRFKVC